MDKAVFYGESLALYEKARLDAMCIIEKCDQDKIHSVKSRIKEPESLIRTMELKGKTLEEITDIIGIRVICNFIADVYDIVNELKQYLTIKEEKDYIDNPKKNGYRSYHIVADINGILVEIQVRTLAIDFWATLEHRMRYKKNIENTEVIEGKLKDVADEVAALDMYMQCLNDAIICKEERND